MAGLTREQRAEREALKQAEQQDGVASVEDVEPGEPSVAVEENSADSQPEDQQEGKDGQSHDDAIAFVMMKRDPDKYDAPHTAQVHPDEVVNYYSGGWVVDKD